jgi:hypothetical protein
MRNHAVPIPSSQLLVITKNPTYPYVSTPNILYGYLGKPKPQFCKIAGYCTYTPAVPCLAVFTIIIVARDSGEYCRAGQSRAGQGFWVFGFMEYLLGTRPLTRSWPARSLGRSLVLLSPRFNCLCFAKAQCSARTEDSGTIPAITVKKRARFNGET